MVVCHCPVLNIFAVSHVAISLCLSDFTQHLYHPPCCRAGAPKRKREDCQIKLHCSTTVGTQEISRGVLGGAVLGSSGLEINSTCDSDELIVLPSTCLGKGVVGIRLL